MTTTAFATKPAPRRLLQRLTALPGKVRKDDHRAFVARLRRPYYRLSKQQCLVIERLAGDSDVLLLDGRAQVTWGDADGGKALMPLAQPL